MRKLGECRKPHKGGLGFQRMGEAKDLVDDIGIAPVRFKGEQGIAKLLAKLFSFLQECLTEPCLVDTRDCHQDCPARVPGMSLPTANTRGRSSIR